MSKPTEFVLGRSDIYGITLIVGVLGLIFTGRQKLVESESPSPTTAAVKPTQEQQDARLIVGQRLPSSNDTSSFSTSLWGEPWEKEELASSQQDQEPATRVGDLLLSVCTKPNEELLILPVIVNGRADAESKRSRVRRRHAVEMALNSFGYGMRYPDRMTYKTCKIDYHLTDTESIPARFNVPLKLYRYASGNSFVLVMWIKEEFLGTHPMHALGQLIHEACDIDLDAKYNQLACAKLAICGPTYSETLRRMTDVKHEATKSYYQSWTDPQILNPSCTSTTLDPIKSIQVGSKTIPIHHFINSDDQLTHLLSAELDRRGIGLGQQSRIALFVEQGPHEFVQSLVDAFTASEDKSRKPPLIIPYLKGIGTETEQVSDYLSRTLNDVKMRLPDGTMQTDKVQAVGVFGSVTADKLAIVQAARDVFPVATFFTTDLDSRLVENSACRNLIVASHFGFGIEGDLFGVDLGSLSSFRDQFQVSTFLAIGVLASHLNQNEQDINHRMAKTGQNLLDLWGRGAQDATDPHARLVPVIFELGRHGPVQLTGPRPDASENDHTAIRHRPVRRGVPLFDILSVLLISCAAAWLLARVLAVDSDYMRESLGAARKRAKRIRAMMAMLGSGLLRLFNIRSEKPDLNDGSQPAPIVGGPAVPGAVSPNSATQQDPNQIDDGAANTTDWLTFGWIVLSCLGGGLLIAVAISDDRTDGEPLSFFDAISVWPSVFILFAVGTLGLGRIVHEVRQLLESRIDQLEIRKRTLYNGIAMSAIFLLGIVAYVIMAGELNIPPARSARARMAADWTMAIASGALICLAAVSAARILRARGAIAAWEDGFQENFDREFADATTHQEIDEFRRGYESLCLAMEHGTAASRKLLTPAILTVVYATARFPILDSWQMHPSSYVIIFVPLCVSVLAAWAMRRKAQHFKLEATKCIDKYIGRELSTDHAREIEKASEYRGLIGSLNQGPFGPITADPLLGGVVLVATASVTGPFRELLMTNLSRIQ